MFRLQNDISVKTGEISSLENLKKTLDRRKEQLVSEKDKQESAKYIDSLTRYYFEGGNYADLEWELDAIQRIIPRIKTSDINAAVKDYFKWDDVRVFITAPEADAEKLPGKDRVRQLVNSSRKMRVTKPHDKGIENNFLDNTPLPGNSGQ